MAAEWNEDKTPFEILQLEKGSDSSPSEIKKAFHKLALTKHPDRNRDNPSAHNEFIELQRAYDILTDPKALEAWSALQRAKEVQQARRAGHTQKRQKMMEELQRREQGAAVERNQEQAARARLKAELERLRKQHTQRQAAMAAELAAEQPVTGAQDLDSQRRAAEAAAGPSVAAGGLSDEELMRTLKVSWQRGEGEYTAQDLRSVFEEHGPVLDVVLLHSKKKAKGSALVQMATQLAASSAAQEANGDLSRPLLVLPFSKRKDAVPSTQQPSPQPHSRPPTPPHNAAQAPPDRPSSAAQPDQAGSQPNVASQQNGRPSDTAADVSRPNGAFSSFPDFRSGAPLAGPAASSFTAAASSFPAGMPPLFGGGQRDFESVTLMRMRQKAERERLTAQMRAADQEQEA
ncbi:hypothetical protein WJX73_000610 [Symbiochloris irregularis]|uniref:Uncharacterized protein n=1 Tax=Symbiochloris irregularis TaxID=706552 RepID=A0AAW1NV68_9CHLO